MELFSFIKEKTSEKRKTRMLLRKPGAEAVVKIPYHFRIQILPGLAFSERDMCIVL